MVPYISMNSGAVAAPIIAVDSDGYDDWLAKQSDFTRNWISGQYFQVKNGKSLLIPAETGEIGSVLLVTDLSDWNIWSLASLPGKLPEGHYKLEADLDEKQATYVAIGWSLATYVFDRYKNSEKIFATLMLPENADVAHVERTVYATNLARDLINIPTSDMGPKAL